MEVLKRDRDCRNGRMGQSTREHGGTICQMEEGNLFTLMEIIIKESGRTEWQKEKEHLCFRMDRPTKEVGSRTSSMEEDQSIHQKEYTKEILY